MHIVHAEVHPSVSLVQFNQMAFSEDNKYFVRFLLKLFKHTQLFWKSPYTTWITESPALAQTPRKKSLALQCSAKYGLLWLIVFIIKYPKEKWMERFAVQHCLQSSF